VLVVATSSLKEVQDSISLVAHALGADEKGRENAEDPQLGSSMSFARARSAARARQKPKPGACSLELGPGSSHRRRARAHSWTRRCA